MPKNKQKQLKRIEQKLDFILAKFQQMGLITEPINISDSSKVKNETVQSRIGFRQMEM
jgi:hypothetical protein